MINVGIIRYPGSNCDLETFRYFNFNNENKCFFIWHKETDFSLLNNLDLLVLPGGFGTLDELMEAITLIQTSKIKKIPIILVGTAFWSGLIDWLKQILLIKSKTISEEDLNLFSCVDTADEVIDQLKQYYSDTETGPNF